MQKGKELAQILTACDKEPIHIPGSIQPEGFLAVLEPETNKVLQVSSNVSELLKISPENLLGKQLPFQIADRLDINGRAFETTLRRYPTYTILEVEYEGECGSNPLRIVRDSLVELRNAKSIRELAGRTATAARSLTGVSRVMVYRFLPDDSGTVIGEDVDSAMTPFLGLHYPASDIPVQARALYLKQPLRIIFDAHYEPVPIVPVLNPVDGLPIDLSDCALRSVSPVHLQYLLNMGVRCSMSISLVVDGKLWGLIALHHTQPFHPRRDLRDTCVILGQICSSCIQALQRVEYESAQRRIEGYLDSFAATLDKSTLDALFSHETQLLDMVKSSGVALVRSEGTLTIGATPSTTDLHQITSFVRSNLTDGLYWTDRLGEELLLNDYLKSLASGILAIRPSEISSEVIIWFRPEQIETVTWAGDPSKPVSEASSDRLDPRASFGAWKEEVTGRSKPWTEQEIEAAKRIRFACISRKLSVLNIELEKTVEKRTAALQRVLDDITSFAYSVSHDLRTPLRGIIGESRILVEEFGDELSVPVRGGLARVEASALKMSGLISDLLEYVRLGQSNLEKTDVDLTKLVNEVVLSLVNSGACPAESQFTVPDGMTLYGDLAMLRDLLLILTENACKYRKKSQPAIVEFGQVKDQGQAIYFVRDEGIGFDMTFAHKLFLPFERLHRAEEYSGTGIGLANAKRIVDRHGGALWAEGRPGEGSTFYFKL